MIDGDDLWEPHKLGTQLTYLQEHPDVMLCTARVQYFLSPGCEVPAGYRRKQYLFEKGNDVVDHSPGSWVMRADLIDQLGVFSTDYDVLSDVDWWARMKDAQIQYGVLEEVLLHKRVHNSNHSSDSRYHAGLVRAVRASLHRRKKSE